MALDNENYQSRFILIFFNKKELSQQTYNIGGKMLTKFSRENVIMIKVLKNFELRTFFFFPKERV
jgi:hypothetical protein